MVKLFVLILSLSLIAIGINCERATLQEVLNDRIKQVIETTTEPAPAKDSDLPIVVRESTFTIEDLPALSDTTQDSKATQTVDEPAQQECTCASKKPQPTKTAETQTQSVAQSSSASVSVKATKQEKTKKYKVITITLPDDVDAAADAPVESKLSLGGDDKRTEASAVADDQEAKSDEEVKEVVEAESSAVDEADLEKEAAKPAKEVTVKNEKKTSKKSKYDERANNKRDKRETKKSGGKNKRSSEGKSKNGGKNKNNKRKNKK